MKTYNNLYELIGDHNNILLAIHDTLRNKKHLSAQGKDMKLNPEKYISQIQEILKNKNYVPSSVRTKIIKERTKTRNIRIPALFPDQVIQHATLNIVEPILSKGMDYYCCGSVKGRGASRALQAVQKWRRRKRDNKYIMKTDIYHFFPSIDPLILKDKFRNCIRDKDVLNILDAIVDSGIYEDDSGIPIGFYSSQIFSNFYLLEFDHYVKEVLKIRHYVRYVDDMVFMDVNKRKLLKAKEQMNAFLVTLGLHFKEKYEFWNAIKEPYHPIDFVGYRIYAHYTLLRKHIFYSLYNVNRKIKEKGLNYRRAVRYMSYLGYIAHLPNMKKYYHKYLAVNCSKKQAAEYISGRIKKWRKEHFKEQGLDDETIMSQLYYENEKQNENSEFSDIDFDLIKKIIDWYKKSTNS